MKAAIQIFLIIVIIGLSYLVVDSIMQPIRFNKGVNVRKEAVVQRLKDIRSAEVAYKERYQVYTGDFDTLINFVKTDSMQFIRKQGSLSDSLLEAGWTEAKAVKKGLIVRDTIYVGVRDSLFSDDYPIDSLAYVPFTSMDKFELKAQMLETSSKIEVAVFEAKVPNEVYLNGLDEQEIFNMSAVAIKHKKYPGLMVGSVEQSNNNAGNWE